MGRNRRGEQGRVPFRSGRFFTVNNDWYFATRERVEQGPYPTRAMAEASLLNFVRDRSFAHTPARPPARLHDEAGDTGETPPDGPGHSFYW